MASETSWLNNTTELKIQDSLPLVFARKKNNQNWNTRRLGLAPQRHIFCKMAVSWISILGINIQIRAPHMAYETPLHVD